MTVNKITAKSILNKSKIADYTVNCYTGCQHACVYCYARFMKKFTNHTERWGSFVDVKINAAQILEKQMERFNAGGEVMMSSVCDGWQKAEEDFKISRKCLELLLNKSKLSLAILTKSSLIMRDFDIIERFRDRVSLGITVTTIEPSVWRLIEPCSSGTDKRLEILKEAKNRQINTYAFFGPIIPGFSDKEENLNTVFKSLGFLGVSKIYVDKLNYFNGFYRDIRAVLRARYPKTFDNFFEPLRNTVNMNLYTKELSERITEIARRHNLYERTELLFC